MGESDKFMKVLITIVANIRFWRVCIKIKIMIKIMDKVRMPFPYSSK